MLLHTKTTQVSERKDTTHALAADFHFNLSEGDDLALEAPLLPLLYLLCALRVRPPPTWKSAWEGRAAAPAAACLVPGWFYKALSLILDSSTRFLECDDGGSMGNAVARAAFKRNKPFSLYHLHPSTTAPAWIPTRSGLGSWRSSTRINK